MRNHYCRIVLSSWTIAPLLSLCVCRNATGAVQDGLRKLFRESVSHVPQQEGWPRLDGAQTMMMTEGGYDSRRRSSDLERPVTERPV